MSHRRRQYRIVFGGAAGALAMAVAVLGGAAVAGQAATTQQVEATVSCEPGTVKPGRSTGCAITVTNVGGNNVNGVTVTVTAPGTFSSPSSLCTGTSTLTCSFGKLTAKGTPGATKGPETYELTIPVDATSPVVQTISGRYSSATGNNRGDATIKFTSLPPATVVNSTGDFDGRFSNDAAESVQTDAVDVAAGDFYSTGATLGDEGFAVGLTVEEKAAGSNNPNCPTGCFGAKVINFNITPLDGVTYPESFVLTIEVYVGPGVREADIDVLHTTTLYGTQTVPMCAVGTEDGTGDCIVSKPIVNSTKIATVTITGPGSGNGGFGMG